MENVEVATGAESQGEGAENLSPLDQLAGLFGAQGEEVVDHANEADDASDELGQADDAEEVDEPTFTLTVDGTEVTVKQKDLIADAQKYKSATARFEEAAKLRKEADAERDAYKADRDNVTKVIAHYKAEIDRLLTSQQPDWNALLNENPIEYIRQKEIWTAKAVQAQQAEAQLRAIQAQKDAEFQKSEAERTKAEHSKVLEMFPEWKDPEVARKAQLQIVDTLKSAGFSMDEIGGLADARTLAVARKAALYDELVKNSQAQGKQKVAPGVTVKPGVSSGTGNESAKRAALKANHTKNPTVDTLAKLFK